ncbi:MAG: four helix bundle protein [Nitrospirae bacterium]|nr:four helix bundle protein [Nitrospirota bacterium]
MKNYRDLIVWQRSMELVTSVYLATKTFPKEEIYGLVPQIRRSCVSIPSNIAEGYGRYSTNDYLRFLQVSRGSLYELQTQLEVCHNLNYLSREKFEELFEQSRGIERMLCSLIRKVGHK